MSATDDPQFDRDDVEVLEKKTVYQRFFTFLEYRLRHRLYRGGWSEPLTRELFVPDDAVGVLLYDPGRDALALIEQIRVGVIGSASAQRNGISPWLLELVAGVIEDGETPEQVARREAEEEAGVTVQELEPIAEYFSSPGGSNEYMTLYLGRADLGGVGGFHGLEHEHEDIRVFVVPATELAGMVQRGEIQNAHLLIAAQWFGVHHQRLRQQWQ